MDELIDAIALFRELPEEDDEITFKLLLCHIIFIVMDLIADELL